MSGHGGQQAFALRKKRMHRMIQSYNPQLMSRHATGEVFADDMPVEPGGYTPEVISYYGADNNNPSREELEEFMSWMRNEIQRYMRRSLQDEIKRMEENAFENAFHRGFRVNEREAVCHCLTSAIRTFSEAHEPPASEYDRATRHYELTTSNR